MTENTDTQQPQQPQFTLPELDTATLPENIASKHQLVRSTIQTLLKSHVDRRTFRRFYFFFYRELLFTLKHQHSDIKWSEKDDIKPVLHQLGFTTKDIRTYGVLGKHIGTVRAIYPPPTENHQSTIDRVIRGLSLAMYRKRDGTFLYYYPQHELQCDIYDADETIDWYRTKLR